MKQDLNTALKPRLWDFADAVGYLKALYDHRKSLDLGFSYGQWAAELGLKSRSFLRLVLVGQRTLTPDVAELLIAGLDFTQAEGKYFRELVLLSRATTVKQKETHGRELAKLHKRFALKKHDLVEISKADLFDFLSSYKIPRLQVLLTLEDLKKDTSTLAKLLGSKPQEIENQLQILSRLGLAEQLSDLTWKAKEAQVATSDILGNVALQSFHRKSLEEAIQAIDLPVQSRRFQAMVVPMTEEQFQSVHQGLREHLETTLAQLETTQGHNKRLYQINLNMIPVTEPILRDQDHAPVESAETKGPQS